MFVDEARVLIKAGKGGNGAVAFRREKCEPKGGPSGGDGGRGGNVIFIVDSGLKTLMDFRHRRHFFAGNGGAGQHKNMTGKDGEDMIVKVPVGTMIRNEDGDVLADLTKPGEEAIIAKGGRGGKGNARFATSTNQTPKFAQQGETTEELTVILELKLLADVGIIGLPNVGKSTLINIMSTAKAKVGDYPFTTKAPNLGMVRIEDDRDFVVADIPGLVENAHLGKGMGVAFLKHVERARLLVHVLDLSAGDDDTVLKNFDLVQNELSSYSDLLRKLPVFVAGNKIDLPEPRARAERLAGIFKDRGLLFFAISAATGEGVNSLKFALADKIDSIEAGSED
jgi:GTP-binding protein